MENELEDIDTLIRKHKCSLIADLRDIIASGVNSTYTQELTDIRDGLLENYILSPLDFRIYIAVATMLRDGPSRESKTNLIRNLKELSTLMSNREAKTVIRISS